MHNQAGHKRDFFEWKSTIRYFEKKPNQYFRAVVVLAVVLTLFLYFLNEPLMILLVWLTTFVAVVKAAVPPPGVTYKLSKFGFQFFEKTVPFTVISSFAVANKKTADILYIYLNTTTFSEFNIVLPRDPQVKEAVLEFLKERVPYISDRPISATEKIGAFLGRITGLE
jgi:hypothetical protein